MPLSLVHNVAVVGEKGEVKGHMTVSVRFMEGKVVVVERERDVCARTFFDHLLSLSILLT